MMFDYAHEKTDERIQEMQRRIEREYREAINHAEETLNDYFRRFEIKDKKWREWVKRGVKTPKEYKAWRKRQYAEGKRWRQLKEQLAWDYHNANEIAKNIIRGYMPEVYALNHNYSTYYIEHSIGMDTSYTLYNRQAIERILRENPDLLPEPGKKTLERIAAGKDVRWNKNKIQSVMIQSILRGYSMPKIAKMLAQEVGDSNFKAAIRNARTMTTGAQNAGRLDSYKRARAMGIDMRRTWLATLDMRTRHEHRLLDGMTVDIDKPFEVEGTKIRYPGDPDAPGHLKYNCRCTMIAQIKGFEIDVAGFKLRNDPAVMNMSYEEWKMSRLEKTKPILSQYKTGNAIKAQYIKEYRNL